MARFCLKDSDEYYLCLSDQYKRFDPDSPVTNVFFDDTNGQVFTVRSGGVTGVTVTGMDDSKCTSFRMEDRGPIISIKFSPDQKILAIQRNQDPQNATVEFVNFQDLAPTNVEYSHTCKWKNAKILGFVWPRVNEIAFVTDHGIELLQVLPDKKQLKSLKSMAFSGAWFSWCAQSNTVLLAGNNGVLLQPFSLNSSTVTKLQKLEFDATKPVVERDVFLLRLCDITWCAVFRHGTSAAVSAPGPTEVWLMAVSGGTGVQYTHVLRTGLSGRFAVSVLDELVAVHHQSSQTSQLFDILEPSKPENSSVVHIPVVAGSSIQPAFLDGMPCPMYSGTWVVFQPDYIIDARLGCLWRVNLLPSGLAHSVPKEEVARLVAVLLRRTEGREPIYRLLHQLVGEAGGYLLELTQVFDEINSVYRKWVDLEVARNTAGQTPADSRCHKFKVLISQEDICSHVLQAHSDKYLVQVVTALISSVWRHSLAVSHALGEAALRALVRGGARGRLRALARRGALGDGRALACALLSLQHRDPAAAQLALDMMARLGAHDEIVEVLLSGADPAAAAGAARALGGPWRALGARKLLAAGRARAEAGRPHTFVALYHALVARNERLRGEPDFLKADQCDSYVEYYKYLTSEK